MERGKGFQTAAERSLCRGCWLAWLAMNAQDSGIGMRRTGVLDQTSDMISFAEYLLLMDDVLFLPF